MLTDLDEPEDEGRWDLQKDPLYKKMYLDALEKIAGLEGQVARLKGRIELLLQFKTVNYLLESKEWEDYKAEVKAELASSSALELRREVGRTLFLAEQEVLNVKRGLLDYCKGLRAEVKRLSPGVFEQAQREDEEKGRARTWEVALFVAKLRAFFNFQRQAAQLRHLAEKEAWKVGHRVTELENERLKARLEEREGEIQRCADFERAAEGLREEVRRLGAENDRLRQQLDQASRRVVRATLLEQGYRQLAQGKLPRRC
jgi:hypothetical protein